MFGAGGGVDEGNAAKKKEKRVKEKIKQTISIIIRWRALGWACRTSRARQGRGGAGNHAAGASEDGDARLLIGSER